MGRVAVECPSVPESLLAELGNHSRALVFVEILFGHVVFGYLAGPNFPFIGIVSPLYPG